MRKIIILTVCLCKLISSNSEKKLNLFIVTISQDYRLMKKSRSLKCYVFKSPLNQLVCYKNNRLYFNFLKRYYQLNLSLLHFVSILLIALFMFIFLLF